jgi:hypothetical protein
MYELYDLCGGSTRFVWVCELNTSWEARADMVTDEKETRRQTP